MTLSDDPALEAAVERLWLEMYMNHNPNVRLERPVELLDAVVARLREMNRFIRRPS